MPDKEAQSDQGIKEFHAHEKSELDRIIPRDNKHHGKSMDFLQQSVNGWESTFNAISDWVTLIDLECRVIRTNKSGEKFTGLSSAEIVGRLCCRMTHGSTKSVSGCPMEQMIRTGERAEAELQLPDDGRWLSVAVDPLKDDYGKTVAAVHIVRDITQQKRAEEILKGSEQKFRSIFEHANDGIAYLDCLGKILDVNEKVLEIFGSTREELINKHFTKLGILSVKDIPKYLGLFRGILSGSERNVTVNIRNKEGRKIFLECSASLIKPDGEPARVMVIARDITERKRAEKELRLKDMAIAASINAIAIADLNGILKYVNNAFLKMWGYDNVGEVLGKPAGHFWQILVNINDRIKTLRRGGGWIEEGPAQRKDKSLFIVQLSTNVVLDSSGMPLCMMTSFIDVTERRLAEKNLRSERDRAQKYLDVAGVIIVVVDSEGRVGLINKKGCEILGYNEGEILGKNWYDNFLPERIRGTVRTKLNNLINGRLKPGDYAENFVLTKTGQERIIGWHNTVLKDANGRGLCVLSSGEDITERRRAEKKHQTILNTAIDGFCITDLEGRLLEINDSYCRIVGYTREELLKMSAKDIEAIENPEEVLKRIKEMRKKSSGRFETRHRCKDGKIIDVEVSVNYLNVDQGQMFVFIRDITERKRAEQALRESEERYRKIFNSSSVALWEMDLSEVRKYVYDLMDKGNVNISEYIRKNPGCINELIHRIKLCDVNDTALKMFKAGSREDLFRKFGMLLTADSHESFLRCVETYISGGTSYSSEQVHNTATGEVIKVYLTSTIMPGSESAWEKVLITVVDITQMKKLEEVLCTSQAQLSEASKIAKLSYWEYDATENMFTFNDHFYSVYHTTAEQVGGYKMSPKHYAELFLYPDNASLLRNEIQKAIRTAEPNINYQVEHRFIYGDGKPGYVSVTYFVVKDEQGRTIKTYGVNQDITDRKKMEDDLHRQREELQTILDSVPAGIWFKDSENRFLKVNKTAAESIGMKPDDIEGKLVSEVFPADDAEKYYRDDLEVMKSGKPKWGIIEQLQVPGGERRWVHTDKVPCLDEQGNATGIIVFILDITERKRAEDTLRQREELLRATLESTADGILVVNDKGLVTHSNARMMEMWRIPEKLYKTGDDASLLPFAAEQLMNPKDFLARVEMLYKSNDEDFDTLVFKDGRVFERYSCPLIQEGKNTGRVWSFRNVTEQKKAEGRLLEYQKQLKSLASKLTLTEERERRRIAIGLHDQISQSLAISKIKIEGLLHSDVSEGCDKVLRDVRDWLGKAITNTRSLTFDLSSPILYELGFEKAVAAWLEEEIQRKYNIVTEFSNDQKPKPLEDDVRVLLFRDVRELLINVVKHAHAKTVVVSINKVGKMIRVRVEDDGIGFDPAKFAKARKAAFGLFSIRERLEHLGGKFSIDSAPGRGCKVTVLAPLRQDKHVREIRHEY